MRRAIGRLRQFLAWEAAGGIALILAAATALALANSPFSAAYFELLHTPLAGLDAQHWINDALMAGFFLMVGLEVKRELSGGELGTWPRRVLPGAAALGGMAAPALIYLALARGHPALARGWAIPTATDIAFALGVLAMLGPRVPVSLKVFLAALAILDDLGAVAIIALVYTPAIRLTALGGALAVLGLLAGLNRLGVSRLWPYLLTAPVLWALVMASGVHPTLAGVALAACIPHRPGPERPTALQTLEHRLHPWIAFGVLPLFAFANAGVALGREGLGAQAQAAAFAVGLALLVGKPLGVFGASVAAIRFGVASRPAGTNARQLFGVAALCGVGFTMSLFIGALAFPGNPALQDALKLGVLAGSVGSGVLGAAVLLWPARAPAEGV